MSGLPRENSLAHVRHRQVTIIAKYLKQPVTALGKLYNKPYRANLPVLKNIMTRKRFFQILSVPSQTHMRILTTSSTTGLTTVLFTQHQVVLQILLIQHQLVLRCLSHHQLRKLQAHANGNICMMQQETYTFGLMHHRRHLDLFLSMALWT